MDEPKANRVQSSHEQDAEERRLSAPESRGLFGRRNALFLFFLAASAVLFWGPIKTLTQFSMRSGHAYDQYSITALVPFLSAALIYSARKRIFESACYSLGAGACLLLCGIVERVLSVWLAPGLSVAAALSLGIFGLVLFWMGAFTLCFGAGAFRNGLFPVLFLLLTVPLPPGLLDGPVTFVQHGSADVASAVFALFGVPVLRDGLTFSLPVLSIEVAKECSGIHSILALFIIALLAGYLTKLAIWKRLVLLLLVFPIVCLTNGLRISAIALLSNYVNPEIIYSSLHRDGGFLFFGMAMVVLLGVMYLLGVRPRKSQHAAPSATISAAK